MTNGSAARGVAPAAQLHGLLAHPGRAPLLALHVLTTYQGMEGRSFFEEFVGVLGWIDVAMPGWFYPLAGAALLLAVLAAMARPVPILPPRARGLLFLAVLAAVGAIFLLEYLTWTPVGIPFVEGVQGRYFLPVALILVGCLPASGRPGLARLSRAIRPALAAFPALSIAVAVASVVRRYYL